MKKLSLWLSMYKKNAAEYYDNLSAKVKDVMKIKHLEKLKDKHNHTVTHFNIDGIEDNDDIKLKKGVTHYFSYDILPNYIDRNNIEILGIYDIDDEESSKDFNIKFELERIVVNCYAESKWTVVIGDSGEFTDDLIFNSEEEKDPEH